MKIIFLLITLMVCTSHRALSAQCKKPFILEIKMDEFWQEKEKKRLKKEEILLKKYSDYITKIEKPLIAEKYFCEKGSKCDPLKNCQMEKNVENIREVEYQITLDSGVIVSKSYCSEIGKCIGYNDFLHSLEVTAAENRLIDIRKNNAVFYHYFYSANSKNYEPPFNITNFGSGHEIQLNDMPHFSPDDRVIIEVRSTPKQENSTIPTGFNINIYEMNEYGEYHKIEPDEFDEQDKTKIVSTFLTRNPSCGETPHFYSWKSNREVVLSMLPANVENGGPKVILSYDSKTKKWGCTEELFPESKCESYLPNSTNFTSNLTEEQVRQCND